MSKKWSEKGGGVPFCFIAYLLLFGAACALMVSCDKWFVGEIVEVSTYNVQRVTEHPWTKNIFVAMGVVHFIGGIAFFWKLCFVKLGLE